MNAGTGRRAGHAVEAERLQQRVLVVHRPDVHLCEEQHDVRWNPRSGPLEPCAATAIATARRRSTFERCLVRSANIEECLRQIRSSQGHRHGARDFKLVRTGLRGRRRQQALSTGDPELTHEHAARGGVRPTSQRQRTTRNPHVVLLVPQMHISTVDHQNALLKAFSFTACPARRAVPAFISARASRRCGSIALLRAARATLRRAAFAISSLAPGPRRSRVPRIGVNTNVEGGWM
jgi:hypothetical protein